MPSAHARTLSEPDSIQVSLGGRPVGTLACTPQGRTFFEYAPSWLEAGFSVSPFSLPLERRVFEASRSLPDALFGVFRDSLPDDWGRLLVDRRLVTEGYDPARIGVMSRLSLVGSRGLGALEYTPEFAFPLAEGSTDFDELATACQRLIDSDEADKLDTLYRYGSSSGGARPKVMVDLDGEPWIVKFPTPTDGGNAGLLEWRYAEAARACGIEMPEVRLLPSSTTAGFFAIKRFDRIRRADGSIGKVHMASAAALLEASPFDVVDYRDLMRLVLAVIGDARDAEQLYRVMCFNVYAGNCDDHLRNFSFLYDEHEEQWHLSPAYDLTHNEGFMGEHSTLINGKGSEVGVDDLVSVGTAGGVSARKCRQIATEVAEVCRKL